MARDETPEQLVESVLHAYGIQNSGEVAQAVMEAIGDPELLPPPPLTPTEGAMDERQHMAFILRIFLYFVERTPEKQLTVDLEDVLALTKGRQMQVRMEGSKFEARTIPDLVTSKPNLIV